ncbi:cell division protein CrgA [Natronosporangium hydrolyticum]|uniref:Cell division protein CrgA n=1 Tax=Natronosporangium hydrolyticum TaxID=2811111 RepID=A0A895YAE8_9ACTN|nr:cell division protein CrgA [Natronosporangium hydrolyticum]QSB14754.1 cell division protein CrgA [Natronosporangium hydrolyticum]
MPKSTIRKKKVYTPPAEVRPASDATRRKPSPPWLPVSAVCMIVFGIAWLVVFYITTGDYPVAAWGYWNLVIGFGAMVSSLAVLSRWR